MAWCRGAERNPRQVPGPRLGSAFRVPCPPIPVQCFPPTSLATSCGRQDLQAGRARVRSEGVRRAPSRGSLAVLLCLWGVILCVLSSRSGRAVGHRAWRAEREGREICGLAGSGGLAGGSRGRFRAFLCPVVLFASWLARIGPRAGVCVPCCPRGGPWALSPVPVALGDERDGWSRIWVRRSARGAGILALEAGPWPLLSGGCGCPLRPGRWRRPWPLGPSRMRPRSGAVAGAAACVAGAGARCLVPGVAGAWLQVPPPAVLRLRFWRGGFHRTSGGGGLLLGALGALRWGFGSPGGAAVWVFPVAVWHGLSLLVAWL